MKGAAVSDKQNMLWLSTTFCLNDEMIATLNQVQVTEHASVTMGQLCGVTRTGKYKQISFDQFFDLLVAQAFIMEENVKSMNKESFQQRNTNNAGQDCGRGGRDRCCQNQQENNTGTSASNINQGN